MQDYEIKIDKDGLWYYRGSHMFRKDIVNVLFQNLHQDAAGQYFIEMGPERCYLQVEDTAYVITAVQKTKNSRTGEEQIEILLNDDSCEILDLKSLHIGKDNVLYCRVKNNKFEARFSRKAYYQLAEFIEQSDDQRGFFIKCNAEKYFIKNDQALYKDGGTNA